MKKSKCTTKKRLQCRQRDRQANRRTNSQIDQHANRGKRDSRRRGKATRHNDVKTDAVAIKKSTRAETYRRAKDETKEKKMGVRRKGGRGREWGRKEEGEAREAREERKERVGGSKTHETWMFFFFMDSLL